MNTEIEVHIYIYIYNTIEIMLTDCVFIVVACAGILKMFQTELLECRSLEELGQYLGKLPPMDSDLFFPQIESIHFTAKRFKLILSQEQRRHELDPTTTLNY